MSDGSLAGDASQLAVAERLQDLWLRTRGYDNHQAAPLVMRLGPVLRRMVGAGSSTEQIRGLYLVGAVGRGKSMLMDLFFATAAVSRKRRVHFHAFVQEMHQRLYAWKKVNIDASDPIVPLAKSIASESSLLCFDEFQINDIADAMLLGRLFQRLFDLGVVVVATSNIEPANLFKGNPGRDAFLPFIDVLLRHLEVVNMDAGRDFRRARIALSSRWNVPLGPAADHALDQVFQDLTGSAASAPEILEVMGRKIQVPIAAMGVARFDFHTLCGMPLGAGDYLALARRFHTLVIDRIPLLKPDNYDEARRFIVLIDTLYDHRVKLFASAEAAPGGLYTSGEGVAAFDRTVSRLEEMRSPAYQLERHLP